MVAQLFTNTFFFLNGALFNTLIDQGVELDLFQNTMGVKVRELNVQHILRSFCRLCQVRNSLDLLEGWAGREGFKDVILQFFASFSTVVDLLATPPQKLVQVRRKNVYMMYAFSFIF